MALLALSADFSTPSLAFKIHSPTPGFFSLTHNSLALSFFHPHRLPSSPRPWTKITLISALRRATARPPESGAHGEQSLRCCGIAYVLVLVHPVASVRSQSSNIKFMCRATKSRTRKSKSSSTNSSRNTWMRKDIPGPHTFNYPNSHGLSNKTQTAARS